VTEKIARLSRELDEVRQQRACSARAAAAALADRVAGRLHERGEIDAAE
jgi:hypothetical protein